MSLSVPQNGVKADNEPVIELFVKVRPQDKFFSLSLGLTHICALCSHALYFCLESE